MKVKHYLAGVTMALLLGASCLTYAEISSLTEISACIDESITLIKTDKSASIEKAKTCEAMADSNPSQASPDLGFLSVLLVTGKYENVNGLHATLEKSKNSLVVVFAGLVLPQNIHSPYFAKLSNYAFKSVASDIAVAMEMIRAANLIAAIGSLPADPSEAQVTTTIAALVPANAWVKSSLEATLADALTTAQFLACADPQTNGVATCEKLTKARGGNSGYYSKVIKSLQSSVAAGI